MPEVWGLDIGGGGWACVKLRAGEKRAVIGVEAVHLPFGRVSGLPPECALVVIDVPIGLLEDGDGSPTNKGLSGDRAVDKGARKWCRSTSSVFPPPTRGQIESGLMEYARAAAATDKAGRKRRLGNVAPPGLSQQSLAILPAIASAAGLKDRYPDRVYESHPEVVFAAMAGGKLPGEKSSLTGGLGRAAILTAHLGLDCLDLVLAQEGRTGVPADDWLDAISMAAVALDWLAPDGRKVLLSAHGRVETWQGQADRLMALPAAAGRIPETLPVARLVDLVSTQLRRPPGGASTKEES